MNTINKNEKILSIQLKFPEELLLLNLFNNQIIKKTKRLRKPKILYSQSENYQSSLFPLGVKE